MPKWRLWQGNKVMLLDLKEEFVDKGVKYITKNIQKLVEKEIMTNSSVI